MVVFTAAKVTMIAQDSGSCLFFQDDFGKIRNKFNQTQGQKLYKYQYKYQYSKYMDRRLQLYHFTWRKLQSNRIHGGP